MTEDQIKHMANRFLGWKLPREFHPDAGISFDPEFNKEWNARHGKPPSRREPSGTNLFDATQATEMVRYMVEGLPALSQPSPAAGADYVVRHALPEIIDWLEVEALVYRTERKIGNANFADRVVRLFKDYLAAAPAQPAADREAQVKSGISALLNLKSNICGLNGNRKATTETIVRTVLEAALGKQPAPIAAGEEE